MAMFARYAFADYCSSLKSAKAYRANMAICEREGFSSRTLAKQKRT